MLRLKAFKFKLQPSSEQVQKLAQGAGSVRFLWNKALVYQKEKLAKNELIDTYNVMASKLIEWKNDEETSFLKQSHSQVLQQTLKDLDKALFDGFKKDKGMPRFKKKNVSTDGMRFPQGFKVESRRIFVPKIGWIKSYMGRPITGKMKNLTLSLDAGSWFASIQVEEEVPDNITHPKLDFSIGIDLGIKNFATLSNGYVVAPLSSYKKLEKKLVIASKNHSRKEKGSSNKEKSRRKLQKVHAKIRRSRQDFLHKTSSYITKNHGVVVLEDLQVANMSKSAKGSVEKPGKMVKQKSGLNKSILDQGWFEFKRQIKYKLEWTGGILHLVAPNYTSQMCSACGHISSENRKSQSEFVCISCHHSMNADKNAAINIENKALGHRVTACGSNLNRGRKQEPLKKRKVPQKTISEYQTLEVML